jgi:hypothetical protein
MARAQHGGPVAVDVVMTGGHGEWFVRPFDADGLALAPLASLSPDAALARLSAPVVAGSQAAACADARPGVTAMPLWPDARQAGLLPATALGDGAAPPMAAPRRPASRRCAACLMVPVDDLDRIMAVMTTAFPPDYGEAWNRRQVGDALLIGRTRYGLIGADGGEHPEDAETTAGFFLSRSIFDEEELLLFAVAPQYRRRGLGDRC